MTITLYTKPACPQCRLTYLALDAAGITYETVDLTQSATSLDQVKALGYLQAPIVVVDDNTHWSGFQPDRIRDLADRLKENT